MSVHQLLNYFVSPPPDRFRDINADEGLTKYFNEMIKIYYDVFKNGTGRPPKEPFPIIRPRKLSKIKTHLHGWCMLHYNAIKDEMVKLTGFYSVTLDDLTPRLFISSVIHFFNAHELGNDQYFDFPIQMAVFSKLGYYSYLQIYVNDDHGNVNVNKVMRAAIGRDLEIINKILFFLSVYGVNNGLITFTGTDISGLTGVPHNYGTRKRRSSKSHSSKSHSSRSSSSRSSSSKSHSSNPSPNSPRKKT